MPVDGVEVARAGEAVAALHRRHELYAESRFRPLARRRLRITRPARVDMRGGSRASASVCARSADRSASSSSDLPTEEKTAVRSAAEGQYRRPRRLRGCPQASRAEKARCPATDAAAATQRLFHTCGESCGIGGNTCKTRGFSQQARPSAAPIEGRLRTLLCSASSPPSTTSCERSTGPGVEPPIELTAETLWTEISARLQGTLNETTYSTWFGEAEGAELDDDVFVLGVPNDFTREWIEGHFLGLISAALEEATGRELRIDLRVARPAATPPPLPVEQVAPQPQGAQAPAQPLAAPPAPRRQRDEPEVHVRLVRDRLVEPVRARGRARGRRGARAGLQPALHLRRHRPRQDAPAAGDRELRGDPHRRHLRPLRHERDVHERLHQQPARQADRRLQAALPHLRRADDRRRPVLRAQGADPGGVLPHVQQPLRGRSPDRHELGPAPARDLDARGAAALALRVGADHRHPAARPRDADRDPAQEGEDGRHPRARRAGADLHRRPHLDATSASSRARSPASSPSPASPAGR